MWFSKHKITKLFKQQTLLHFLLMETFNMKIMWLESKRSQVNTNTLMRFLKTEQEVKCQSNPRLALKKHTFKKETSVMFRRS